MLPGQTAATLPDVFGLPAGTFFDSAAIHVLSTGTVTYMRKLIGDDVEVDSAAFAPTSSCKPRFA